MVTGELYEVDNIILNVLDKLEDHPTFYTRTHTQCAMEEKEEEPVDCEAYFIFNFRDELLSLPVMECYEDKALGWKPYIGSADRHGPSASTEIKTTN